MDYARKSRQSRPRQPAVVRAPTLKEALQKVRKRYGAEACIIESRTVALKQDGRLGQETAVEVLVEPTGTRRLSDREPSVGIVGRTYEADLTEVIAGEVDRIEQLVQSLAESNRPAAVTNEFADYPLATALLAAGADVQSVRRLASAFVADPRLEAADEEAAMAHLRTTLRSGEGDWRSFSGCHVFLGDSGAGKSDLVLAAAAKLQAAGKRTLVLNVLPKHGGEVRRLQLEAAQHSYDAALIQRPEQLLGSAAHLVNYDVVLIDTPAFLAAPFAAAGELQGYLSQNESFHRHFVVPLDLDFRDVGDLWDVARLWNCDWLILSRLDRSRRKGKIIDLLGRLPLPISFCTFGPWPESEPQIASADQLAALIVPAEQRRLAARARA